MNQVYTDILPEDYFDNLFEKVSRTINRGENVCISVMYGQSNKTIYSFLHRLILQKKLFDKVLIHDPILTNNDPIEFTKKAVNKYKSSNKLIVFRFFEQTTNRRKMLEILKSIQDQNRHKIVYLAIADYSAILNPIEYTANTTVFFSDCIYVPPFTKEQTKSVIGTLKEYYGWKVNSKDYEQIFNLSGGIGRLIKYICKTISEEKISLKNTQYFINNMAISFELDYLTKILIRTPREKIKILQLIDENNHVKSSLLREYFRNYKVNTLNKIYPNLS